MVAPHHEFQLLEGGKRHLNKSTSRMHLRALGGSRRFSPPIPHAKKMTAVCRWRPGDPEDLPVVRQAEYLAISK